MSYVFPFGQELKRLVQEDVTPKKVFVLGVYSSAVHARWKKDGAVVCQALAVASEPRIFWDGNQEEADSIISKIQIPKELGYLEPASKSLNGPSAKVLDEKILAPLGFERKDAWLCDLLPEARINPSQAKAIKEKYNPHIEGFSLNRVTVPLRPEKFCDIERCNEITDEIMRSNADLLVLLGDIPISQYLKEVADVNFSSLSEFCQIYGYGNSVETQIGGRSIKVLPLAHPRQIGGLGAHSQRWYNLHNEWYLKNRG